jgi:hypothetical protein
MTSSKTEEWSSTPLHAKIEQMLTEARVVLPGAQALFGFQLATVLTQSRIVRAASLLLIALTVVLLMTPAAYHRLVYAGEDRRNRPTCTWPRRRCLRGDYQDRGVTCRWARRRHSGPRFINRALVCLPVGRGVCPDRPSPVEQIRRSRVYSRRTRSHAYAPLKPRPRLRRSGSLVSR